MCVKLFSFAVAHGVSVPLVAFLLWSSSFHSSELCRENRLCTLSTMKTVSDDSTYNQEGQGVRWICAVFSLCFLVVLVSLPVFVSHNLFYSIFKMHHRGSFPWLSLSTTWLHSPQFQPFNITIEFHLNMGGVLIAKWLEMLATPSLFILFQTFLNMTLMLSLVPVSGHQVRNHSLFRSGCLSPSGFSCQPKSIIILFRYSHLLENSKNWNQLRFSNR